MARSESFVIDVTSAGVNRADLLQRAGKYAPPSGVPDILGLEVSGHISAIPNANSQYQLGQEVVALLPGGGQQRHVAVPQYAILPMPTSWTLIEAGGLMEAACTTWSNLVAVAQLQPKETVLILGGSGGIGTFAIQFAKALGARVITMARTPERARRCAALGADHVIVYQEHANLPETLPKLISELSNGEGVNVVLDVLGGRFIDTHIDCLADDGRLVVIGLQKGSSGAVNLGKLLTKRGSLHGTTLRSRPAQQKASIVQGVYRDVWPLLETGAIKPVLHQALPLLSQEYAHSLLATGEVFGKLVLLP